jgi:hypothetical protein
MKFQVKKGWACTEGWRDRAREELHYVIEPISLKFQVKKG